jgi:hypothetical protein
MRRALLALPLLALAALPALAGAPAEVCGNAKDPASLLPPGEAVALAGLGGFDLTLAQSMPLLPAGEAPDNHPCSGKLRPGVQLIINGGWLCTANWVYEDDLGQYYLGTAGHCAVPGNNVVASGVGRVGDVVFSTGNGGVGNDFALIRIDPLHYGRITPTMCHWGGPVGVAGDEDFAYVPHHAAVHYGHGYLWGGNVLTRPRTAQIEAIGFGDESFLFEGTIAPGDSGSAIQLANGRVLGVITHGFLAPSPLPPVGVVVSLGTSVAHGLAMAEAATGRDFEVTLSNVNVDLTGLGVN